MYDHYGPSLYATYSGEEVAEEVALREGTHSMLVNLLARRLHVSMMNRDPSFPWGPWETLSNARRDMMRSWVQDLLDHGAINPRLVSAA